MSIFKQLFNLLFGQRHEPTVEASPVAVQEGLVAPGTNIRFHPELIDKLTGDHHLLLSLFGETSHAAAQGDVAAAAERLEAFRTALQGHLLTENIRLYVYLEHLFADDPSTYSLIHEFRHEMDGIGKAVISFLLKYEELATHPELAAAFAHDLAGIGKVLVSRIEREEGTLYPLYTG
ncbi:MAG: hemerythrin domain-containing protein [Azonexus sp.]|jgi:hypothetical protein|uniref:hemerythrin domain-containing protein n=1 Tax=Azonexus sp. TaxID=1872668 RepID=UPI00282A9120|nr:hemerythrin domain-containing protein [Azonexus sp.]MDR0776314.1 hemerythrin domain-containing protein [Azonexus sp.]